MFEEYFTIKEWLSKIENKQCQNCYFKETAGDMVDPCFPCVMEDDKYPKSNWRPDTWTKKELENYENLSRQYIDYVLDNDPNYQDFLKKMIIHLNNKKRIQCQTKN